jgi:DNA sulfur modification protein DndE
MVSEPLQKLWLRFLAGKTGLTPNKEREFNRYTLLGEYDPLFVALLKERCRQDDLNLDVLPDYFRAYMNRGVALLQKRVKGLADIAHLVRSLAR